MTSLGETLFRSRVNVALIRDPDDSLDDVIFDRYCRALERLNSVNCRDLTPASTTIPGGFLQSAGRVNRVIRLSFHRMISSVLLEYSQYNACLGTHIIFNLCSKPGLIKGSAYVVKNVCIGSQFGDQMNGSDCYYVPESTDEKLGIFLSVLLQDALVCLMTAFDTFSRATSPSPSKSNSLMESKRKKQLADFHFLLSNYEAARNMYSQCLAIFKSENEKLWAEMCAEGTLKAEIAQYSASIEDARQFVKKIRDRVNDTCTSLSKNGKPFLSYLVFTELIQSFGILFGDTEVSQHLGLAYRYLKSVSREECAFARVELACMYKDKKCKRKQAFENEKIMKVVEGKSALPCSLSGLLNSIYNRRGMGWAKIDHTQILFARDRAITAASISAFITLSLTLLFKCYDSIPASQQQEIINEVMKRKKSVIEAPSHLRSLLAVFKSACKQKIHSPTSLKAQGESSLFIVSSLKSDQKCLDYVASDELVEISVTFSNPLDRPLCLDNIQVRGVSTDLISAILSPGSRQQSLLLSFRPQDEGKYLFDEIDFELLGVRFRYHISGIEFECIGPQPHLTVIDRLSPDLTRQYIHGEFVSFSLRLKNVGISRMAGFELKNDRKAIAGSNIVVKLDKVLGISDDSETTATIEFTARIDQHFNQLEFEYWGAGTVKRKLVIPVNYVVTLGIHMESELLYPFAIPRLISDIINRLTYPVIVNGTSTLPLQTTRVFSSVDNATKWRTFDCRHGTLDKVDINGATVNITQQSCNEILLKIQHELQDPTSINLNIIELDVDFGQLAVLHQCTEDVQAGQTNCFTKHVEITKPLVLAIIVDLLSGVLSMSNILIKN